MENQVEVNPNNTKQLCFSSPKNIVQKSFYAKSVLSECRKLSRSIVFCLHEITSDTDMHYEIELILTEAFSNVVVHGYDGHEDGDVTIDVSVDELKRLYLKVMDWGKPFRGPDTEALELHQDLYMESGRGIFIISQLVDRFSYEHEDGKNTLHIEKDLRKKKLKQDT